MKKSLVTAMAILASQFGKTQAQETAADAPSTGHLNAVTPTLGGKQFWADELFFHRWHIQRNALTGHYRLLDDRNYRYAWGSFEECCAKLEQIKRDGALPAMQGKAVIVMHGLFRTSASMGTMGRYLEEKGNYTVFNVGYPSTRAEIESHARGLARVLEHLDGIEEINFVAHSLGNLVIRRYLSDATDEQTGRRPDPRIRRIVMLGPPNNGARLAQILSKSWGFEFLLGASGQDLSAGWSEIANHLATPACEFGVIAGGRGDDNGYNPLLPGDDDMVVAVTETKLPGARDFEVLPVKHTFMMNDPQALEHTLRFLESGHFVAEDRRRPITSE